VNEPLDVRALAEALVDVLAERGMVMAPDRVLDAAEVAELLGRDRHWVYDHARELGAFRFGDGPKARLGFDRTNIERWKRDREIRNGSPTRPGAPTPEPTLIPFEPPGRAYDRRPAPIRRRTSRGAQR
jgi:predicted DNA-binding transcriptional regulator AlpA